MVKKSVFFICLFTLATFVGNAQVNPDGKTYQLNLQQCLEYAYANNDSLKNARLDIESANYKVKETIGLGLPQVSGTADFQDFLKSPVSLLPAELFEDNDPATPAAVPGTFVPVSFVQKYQSSLGINVNQLLFSGTYLVGLQASKTYKELSQRNLTRTKIQT